MRHFSLRHVLATAVFVGANAIAISYAPAAIVAGDTFTLTDTRTAGSSLNGQTTEVGGLTWIAKSDLILATGGKDVDAGSIQTNSTGNNASTVGTAYVPFTPSAGQTVTLEAQIKPMSSNSSNWIALAFANDTTSGMNGGGPWVLLTAGGGMQLFEGPGTNNFLGQKYPDSFVSGDYNLVSLQYNTASHKASVSLNGTPVDGFQNVQLSTGPTIDYAGFMFYSQYDSSSATPAGIDDFQVSAVPEPTSVSLLAVGGLALLRRRRQGA